MRIIYRNKMEVFCVFLLCVSAVIQLEPTAANAYKDPYDPLPHRGGVGRREAGSCAPNSEDYEQKTDALTCQEEYLKAVEEEIQRSNCKNTQYVDSNDYDYDDGNSSECDGPRDEREGVPRCSEACSLRQYYYLYCTYLGEQNAEIEGNAASRGKGQVIADMTTATFV